MKKVKLSKISATRKDNTKGVPLVVTYHAGLKYQPQFTPFLYGSRS